LIDEEEGEGASFRREGAVSKGADAAADGENEKV
jgi:hypothetical protein